MVLEMTQDIGHFLNEQGTGQEYFKKSINLKNWLSRDT